MRYLKRRRKRRHHHHLVKRRDYPVIRYNAPRKRNVSLVAKRSSLFAGALVLRDNVDDRILPARLRRLLRYDAAGSAAMLRRHPSSFFYQVTPPLVFRKSSIVAPVKVDRGGIAAHGSRYRFVDPVRVLTCVKRKERRNSLFGTGKAGKGKKIFGDREWKDESYIRC